MVIEPDEAGECRPCIRDVEVRLGPGAGVLSEPRLQLGIR